MAPNDAIRILLLADTHLGLDFPIRPRVQRRRRGPDFFERFHQVLDHAKETRPDLVVHGGDLFFRSKLPPSIVDRVYTALLEFARHGIPLILVPGNHERSRLPDSLFLTHPGLHLFESPRTIRFDIRGTKVALSGFPCRRDGVRANFASLLKATGWTEGEADVRLLCLHQAVDGARVGPADFEFRGRADTVRHEEIPEAFLAVLAGHIHRAQVVRSGTQSPPVLYPGSTERTSFAEMREEKGFLELSLRRTDGGAFGLEDPVFNRLPARPMIDLRLPRELRANALEAWLGEQVSTVDPDAILRIDAQSPTSPEVAARLTAEFLREQLPESMNFQLRHTGRSPSPRDRLIGRIRAEVPHATGVYRFLDQRGDLIYVGKSVDLRARMLSYFRHGSENVHGRTRRLAFNIRDFSFETTQTELLALLREDELIKEHRPLYNVRQNEFLEARYLRFTEEPFPVGKIVEQGKGARLFGPFKDRHFVESLLDLLHRYFGLRRCTDIVPKRHCPRHRIGVCSGPCRAAISRRDYQARVAEAAAFLRGESVEPLRRLTCEMRAHAEAQEFEKAEQVRKQVDFVDRFGRRQQFVGRFARERLVVRSGVDRGEAHIFNQGRLVAILERADDRGITRALEGSVTPEQTEDPRFLGDRAAIVFRWIERQRGQASFRFE